MPGGGATRRLGHDRENRQQRGRRLGVGKKEAIQSSSVQFQSTENAEEKRRCRSALASVFSLEKIKELLSFFPFRSDTQSGAAISLRSDHAPYTHTRSLRYAHNPRPAPSIPPVHHIETPLSNPQISIERHLKMCRELSRVLPYVSLGPLTPVSSSSSSCRRRQEE